MATTEIPGRAQEGSDARRLLAEALAVAGRRRYIMLVVFVAAMLGGLVVVGMRQVSYRADAFLVVSPAPPPELSSREVPVVSDVISATAARSLATHVAMMKTPAVMARAYEDLPRRYHSLLQSKGGRPQPVVSVDQLWTGTIRADVIRVSVTWHDPEAAAALANAVARRHIRFAREFNRDIARSALPYLETELEAARRKVEEAERALLAQRRESGLYNPDEQIRAKTAGAAAAEKAADEAALEREAVQAQLEKLRAAIAREPAMQTSQKTEDSNPVVQSMRSEVADLKVRRSGMLTDFSPGSPDVRHVDSQIAAAERVAATEKPTVMTSEGKSLNTVREELRQQAALLEAQVAAAAARERENRRLYQRYVKELEDMNAAQARLLEFDTAAELLRDYYRLLRERSQTLTMRTQERLADVNILGEAEPPTSPVGPPRIVQGSFIVFLAVMLACGAALVAELFGARHQPLQSPGGFDED